ncbi:hypothetical protein HHK36_025459 [Tetracentron sinense]|uniref:BHLH domain-containing protein n=1 Tax=Tetracentron sinense TaxID=13715 RepID=A0A834YHK3_TETSI|nr:hypothetical protein HHK36_025459 [Tetracentron sinense]
MAAYGGDLQSFKLPLPFLEMDSNMELITQFAELNPSVLGNSNFSIQNFMDFSNDNFLAQYQLEFPVNFTDNLPGLFHSDGPNAMPIVHPGASAGDVCHGSKKRNAIAITESSSINSYPLVSETGLGGDNKTKRKNSLGGGKRGRNNEKEVEKPKGVVHVRARRGQATDSHSLAERVRRGKINEKLKCLQDIVPGCYKTMGMAVMLDEIINYVQSLQNQVEFLSMNLTTASSFYDYNSEMEATKEIMQGTNAYEAKEMERLMTEGYGGLTCFHSTWPF